MQLDYAAIIVATIAQFIFGWIWYMPIFGKLWGKIHDFDQVPPEKQKEMMKDMWKPLVWQFIFTLVTTVVFAKLLNHVSGDWSIYCWAFMFWLGFILPTQVAAVLFGGTKPKWVMTKLAIMALGALGCMEIIAVVFTWMI